MTAIIRAGMLVAGFFLLLTPTRSEEPGWVGRMKEVHAKFKGTKGTFAHFGDSITVTMAFWTPLAYDTKGMDADTRAAHALVKQHMHADCWRNWKGPDFGNTGSMTIRWA